MLCGRVMHPTLLTTVTQNISMPLPLRHVLGAFSVDKRSKRDTLNGLKQQLSCGHRGAVPSHKNYVYYTFSCVTAWWPIGNRSSVNSRADESEWRVRVSHPASMPLKTDFCLCWKQNQLHLSHVEVLCPFQNLPSCIKLWIRWSRCYGAWNFTKDVRDGAAAEAGWES